MTPGARRTGRALGILIAVVSLAMSLPSGAGPEIPKPRAVSSTNRPDTVVVFGSNHYVRGSSGSWTAYAENVSITSFDSTRRFIFRITNGDAQGQNRVSQVSLILNGSEVMNASDVTTGVPFAIKVATPKATNTLQVSVAGATNSFIDLDMISTPDPSYPLYAGERFTMPLVPEDWQLGDPPPPPTYFTRSFSKPSAAAGPYTLVLVNGAPDGTLRTSADLWLNGPAVVSSSDLNEYVGRLQRQVALLAQNSFAIALEGEPDTYVTVSFMATDTTPPVVTLTGPPDGLVTTAAGVGVSGSVSDETHGTVRVNSQTAFTTPGSFSDSVGMPTDGRYAISVHAANSAGYGTDVVRWVTRDTRAPTLTVSQPTTPTTSDNASFVISWIDSTATTMTVDVDTVGTGASDTLSYTVPLDMGPNGIFFRATDAAGNDTSFKRYVFRNADNEPDTLSSGLAANAAGTLPSTEITSYLDRNRFLYTTGNPPLQTQVVQDSIVDSLAAVIHGQVTSRDFGPLPNVTVQVLGRPWFGQTTTRADGRFDMVVNGGASLTLRFTKPGYLEAQRSVLPLWNDDAVLDSVALIGKTSRRSVMDFSNPQVARGRFQTDGNGDRDIRMYFQQGTTAKVADVGGDTATFAAVRTRATEYTVGSDGRNAMPAILPPASAYTYCVDLSLDEADSAATASGTPYARFTKPVACYVRNFLHLPVGTAVPAGSYDSKTGQWKAGKDGVTIRILSTTGGIATIDSRGNGVADDQTRLYSLGIDSTERQRLAQQYATGDTIWRITVDHFSTWDFNINLAQVAAQQSPTAGRAGQPLGIVGEACTATGSIIECENRVLGEQLPIVGTPYTLNYRSYRQPGDIAIRTLRIPVTGATVPTGLQRIVVLLDVAGRRYRREVSVAPNQVATIDDWDGNDAFGRRV